MERSGVNKAANVATKRPTRRIALRSAPGTAQSKLQWKPRPQPDVNTAPTSGIHVK